MGLSDTVREALKDAGFLTVAQITRKAGMEDVRRKFVSATIVAFEKIGAVRARRNVTCPISGRQATAYELVDPPPPRPAKAPRAPKVKNPPETTA